MKRIALITGANKGIGLEIARQLAAGHQMTVLLGARDPQRGESAAAALREEGLDAHYLPLDVTSAQSVAAAAKSIEEKHGRLDALVNNAGVAKDPYDGNDISADDLRATYETNVFGPMQVTQAMLPLLGKSDAGRVVNVSSSLGSLNHNSDPGWDYASVKPVAYNTSKAALNMLTVILAARHPNLKVNSACPGYTRTDLTNNQGTRTVEEGARAPVRLATLPADGPTGGFFDEDGQVPW